jgi:large subunit ribosomal protein L10
MVSQKNVQMVKEVSEQLKKYPVVGILNMHSLPASQLHQIRTKLRGKAVIRMVKKRLIILALKESGLKGLETLGERLQGEPALVMTELNPFKLAHMIDKNKSSAPAKDGDVAPMDIVVNAGPTPLPPGPVIGELQKAKIPATIEGDKIHVREDTVIAKEGDEINSLLAGVMAKLGMTPMEIGLNLLAAWESGTVYDKGILFIPQERYVQDLVSAHQGAFNLAYNIGYPTKETLPLLLSKARQEAYSLALSAGILTKETVKPLLSKAHAQMEALKSKAGLAEASPEPKEEDQAKEEKPIEETKPEGTDPQETKEEDKPEEDAPAEEGEPKEGELKEETKPEEEAKEPAEEKPPEGEPKNEAPKEK